MSEQFFIRLRGRIQGPYNTDQLQSLAKRGQFSRAHEVSSDGVQWARASGRPELFPPVMAETATPLMPLHDAPTAPELPPVAGSSEAAWYYHLLGINHGPVDFNYLLHLVNTGKLVAADIVWKEGMPEWITAGSVPGLISGPATTRGQSTDNAQTRPCPFCAEPIVAWAIKCKHCGSVMPSAQSLGADDDRDSNRLRPTSSPNSPILMALLSFCCLAGLGQIVLGQTIKGVMILLGSMVLAVVTGGFSVFVTWPLGGLDAYLIAKKLQSGKSVGQWECF